MPDFRQGWSKEEIFHAIASAQGDFPVDEALVEGRQTDTFLTKARFIFSC